MTVKTLGALVPGDRIVVSGKVVTVVNNPTHFTRSNRKSSAMSKPVNFYVRRPDGELRSVTGEASAEIDLEP